MSGPIPPDPSAFPAGQAVAIPHVFIAFAADGKITRLDAYWDNASTLNGPMKSVSSLVDRS